MLFLSLSHLALPQEENLMNFLCCLFFCDARFCRIIHGKKEARSLDARGGFSSHFSTQNSGRRRRCAVQSQNPVWHTRNEKRVRGKWEILFPVGASEKEKICRPQFPGEIGLGSFSTQLHGGREKNPVRKDLIRHNSHGIRPWKIARRALKKKSFLLSAEEIFFCSMARKSWWKEVKANAR